MNRNSIMNQLKFDVAKLDAAIASTDDIEDIIKLIDCKGRVLRDVNILISEEEEAAIMAGRITDAEEDNEVDEQLWDIEDGS